MIDRDEAQHDIADDVTNFDPVLARLNAAALPFRAWADDKCIDAMPLGIISFSDGNAVSYGDLRALIAAIDAVLSKGELK